MKFTHEYLLKILHYNPETGIFTWLKRPEFKDTLRTDRVWNAQNAGKQAGSVGPYGYLRIVITFEDKVHYVGSHRLAWFYMTKEWPPADIDHINLDIKDNRFCNLRLATRSQNNANAKPPRDNKSGKKGVFFDTSRQLWRMEIKCGNIRKAARFPTFEEACEARRRIAIELFGEFAREQAGNKLAFLVY